MFRIIRLYCALFRISAVLLNVLCALLPVPNTPNHCTTRLTAAPTGNHVTRYERPRVDSTIERGIYFRWDAGVGPGEDTGIFAAQAKAARDRGGTVAPPNGQAGALRPVGARRCVEVCVLACTLGSWAAARVLCAPHAEGDVHCACAGPELDQGHCGYGRTACCAPASESAVCGLWRVVCGVRWAGETSAAHRKMQDLPSGAARGGARDASARTQPAARAVAQPAGGGGGSLRQ